MSAHQPLRINSRILQRNALKIECNFRASIGILDKCSFTGDLKSKPTHAHIAQRDARRASCPPSLTLMTLLLFARGL